LQEAGRAGVSGRRKIGNGLHLLLGLSHAARKHRTTQRMRRSLHHRASRREMVRKAVINQLARAESGRVQRAGEAPIIFALAFGFVDGTGRSEYTGGVAPAYGRKAAKQPADLR